jgi:hypothetical protein
MSDQFKSPDGAYSFSVLRSITDTYIKKMDKFCTNEGKTKSQSVLVEGLPHL